MFIVKTIVRRSYPENNSNLVSLHPLLRRIYAARQVVSEQELSRELKELLPFDALSGIDAAVARLFLALKEQQRILILGDFDADGATSTALATAALRAMGAAQVSYLVPNRFAYGYGLTPEIVDVAHEKNPQLIITVDNGISSNAGVDHANNLGIDVLITDHHLAAAVLPKACAIVNPNQPGDRFPSKYLAGVGVIFYVMLALRAHLKAQNWFETKNLECPNMSEFLDLVALGTVADVVPLDKNNRILVHQGLRRIRAGHMRPGIQALLQISGREANKMKAQDLGFAIGPRLNAAGRLDDMSLGIACLLAPNLETGLEIANQLDDLNKKRRVIENTMQNEAFSSLDRLNFKDDVMPAGICLFQEDWHQGVVGLVASRVKEKTNRPAIAFARANDGTIKGSARSITGLHIRDVLEAIAAKYPDLITKFGGHAMAAGMSLQPEKFEEFKTAFADEVAARVSKEDLEAKIFSDGELNAEELRLDIAELIQSAGPWGQGFPEPLFDGEFAVISQRIVGQRHLKLVLQAPGCNEYIDGIAFNVDLEKWPNYELQRAKLAYRMEVNDFNNRKRLQLLVEELVPVL